MPKAKTKTTGRNTDAEDRLGDRLRRATALVHIIAQASPMNVDHMQYNLALEAVWDLLNDAVADWGDVSDVLDKIEWSKDEPPADDKPLDKKLAKDIIARVKQATKPKTAKPHWKTVQKQQREAAANGTGEHAEGGAQ